jgi:hypothetical protein
LSLQNYSNHTIAPHEPKTETGTRSLFDRIGEGNRTPYPEGQEKLVFWRKSAEVLSPKNRSNTGALVHTKYVINHGKGT